MAFRRQLSDSAGTLCDWLRWISRKRTWQQYAVTLIAVFLYQAGIGHHLDKVIIGSIIPLVPGVNFTNAIRDIADQDYIAGSVRMLDALLVTFCIALGVGLIITGYHQLAGGLQL